MRKIITALPLFSLSVVLVVSGCNAQETPINQIESTATETLLASSDPEILSEQQKAEQAVKEMFRLAQAGDWHTYIDRYYGELHKLRSPADKEELARRFREEKWGKIVIATLEQAHQVTPEIEGDLAKFEIDLAALRQANRDIPEVIAHLARFENEEYLSFDLHRTADGDWKYHM